MILQASFCFAKAWTGQELTHGSHVVDALGCQLAGSVEVQRGNDGEDQQLVHHAWQNVRRVPEVLGSAVLHRQEGKSATAAESSLEPSAGVSVMNEATENTIRGTKHSLVLFS
jgi:hypothetical protein